MVQELAVEQRFAAHEREADPFTRLRGRDEPVDGPVRDLDAHVRRRAPEVAAIKRFVSGLIVNKPDYDDLSPPMAEAVRKHMPTYWASINRMGRATAAKKFDTDKNGNDLYVVNQRGGRTHWNLIVNPNGKITSAFMCQGEGL